MRPGTVLGHANRVLAPHGRKLGPDPASTDIATVGGVIANNSGGMRCGTWADSYSTVAELTLLTALGHARSTPAPPVPRPRSQPAEPALAAGLAEIRDEIRADAELVERIRRKFAIKNTTGYRLCAFLDADEPLEIFRRLSSAPRAPSRSSARRCSKRFQSRRTRPPPGSTSRGSRRPASRCRGWSSWGRAPSS